MKRTKLFQYKLGEFSQLSGIDTYRLKKLDESGLLKANVYNGRRYYDDVALALSPLFREEVFEPSVHDIKMEVEKLMLLIDRNEKDFTKKRKNNNLLLYEKEMAEVLFDQNAIDIKEVLVHFGRYLTQLQLLLNRFDGDNEIVDLKDPIFTQNKNGK